MGHTTGVSVGNATVTGLVQAVDAETGKLVVVSQVSAAPNYPGLGVTFLGPQIKCSSNLLRIRLRLRLCDWWQFESEHPSHG